MNVSKNTTRANASHRGISSEIPTSDIDYDPETGTVPSNPHDYDGSGVESIDFRTLSFGNSDVDND